jgi:hypothetical protein
MTREEAVIALESRCPPAAELEALHPNPKPGDGPADLTHWRYMLRYLWCKANATPEELHAMRWHDEPDRWNPFRKAAQ